jgi:Fur family peroxide stress response transcriptional regulator
VNSIEHLIEVYRETNRKITPQRLAVFRILDSNTSHPTAEEIYAEVKNQIGNVSLKTVYQTLNELESLDQIQIIDVGTGTSRYDPNVNCLHQHFVCKKCSKVKDVDLDVSTDLLDSIDRNNIDFKVDKVEIVLRGLCDSCEKSS